MGQDDLTKASQTASERQTGKRRSLTFCFDIDGVIATTVPDMDYSKASPMVETIGLINQLYENGHHIVLFTARGSATGIEWQEVTQDQMSRWNVKHHELKFGKPPADYYIDDRFITLEQAAQIAKNE